LPPASGHACLGQSETELQGREGKGREGKGEARGREERKVSPVVLDVLPRSKCCVLQNCLCQIHGCEEDVDV